MEHDDYSDTLLEMKHRRASRRRIDFVLRVYSVMGLLLAIIASAYFGLTLLPVDLSSSQQIALATAGIGIALTTISRTLIILRKQRENEEIEKLQEYKAISDFLETWSQFESASKSALAEGDSDINIHSLRAVISRLLQEGKINRADVQALDNALQTRNAIVHGGQPLTANMARNVTETLREIIKKLTAVT